MTTTTIRTTEYRRVTVLAVLTESTVAFTGGAGRVERMGLRMVMVMVGVLGGAGGWLWV